jgi:hypothetical protein
MHNPEDTPLDAEAAQVISDDSFTNSIPDMQKLHNIVKGMRNNAAPRPDGLSAAFYKASWN